MFGEERFRMGDWKVLLRRLDGSCRPGVLGVWLTPFSALATALTFFLPVYRHEISAQIVLSFESMGLALTL